MPAKRKTRSPKLDAIALLIQRLPLWKIDKYQTTNLAFDVIMLAMVIGYVKIAGDAYYGALYVGFATLVMFTCIIHVCPR